MPRKARTPSSTTPRTRTKRLRSMIPEPFQLVSSATVARGAAKVEVPMLVIYGEWLKAVGFPIGSAACVTTDRHGELALNRIGLALPRRLYIRTMPR
jgi:hypothetical protein